MSTAPTQNFASVTQTGVTFPLPVTPMVDSSATGITGSLAYDGTTTNIGPIGTASVVAPPAYHKTDAIPSVHLIKGLNGPVWAKPVIELSASNLVAKAISPRLGVDSISATGSTTLASADLSLVNTFYPPPAVAALAKLTLSATDIRSSSSVSVVAPDHAAAIGDASFGSLSIGGSLIGKTLTFSGDAAPNTVLYSSATVTVTLDKQIVPGPIPGAVVGPPPLDITTDSIDINLRNAHLAGGLVSGDIVIGQSHAGAPFIIVPGGPIVPSQAAGRTGLPAAMSAQDFAPVPGVQSVPNNGPSHVPLLNTLAGTGADIVGLATTAHPPWLSVPGGH